MPNTSQSPAFAMKYLVVPALVFMAACDDSPWYEGTWEAKTIDGSSLPATFNVANIGAPANNISFEVLRFQNKKGSGNAIEQINGTQCNTPLTFEVSADTLRPLFIGGPSITACTTWLERVVRVTDTRATTKWHGRAVELRKR